MSREQKQELPLKIAHLPFVDIVGYSKLLIDEQSEAQEELNEVARNHNVEAMPVARATV